MTNKLNNFRFKLGRLTSHFTYRCFEKADKIKFTKQNTVSHQSR